MDANEDIAESERLLDGSAAVPGSTVWVVWNGTDGSDLAPVTIAATHKDAREWADQQPDPSIYRFTEWRIIGAGWPGVVAGQV